MTVFCLQYNLSGEPVQDNHIQSLERGFEHHKGQLTTFKPSPELHILVHHDPAWENTPTPVLSTDSFSLPIGRGKIDLAPGGETDHQSISLVGNIVGLIWQSRKLLIATSAEGSRGAWYTTVGSTFLCASEPRLLLSHPEVSNEPDLNIVAERLAFHLVTPDQSLYQGIRGIPTGSTLDVSNTRLSIEKWHYFDSSINENLSFDDWTGKIRKCTLDIFRQYLESIGDEKIGLSLSGGLDSSAIAGILAHLGVDSRSHAFMQRYTNLPCDETEYQRAVIEKTEFSPRVFQRVAMKPERDLLEPLSRSLVPPTRLEPDAQQSYRWASQNGVFHRVTGTGGDEIFAYMGESIPKLILDGELGTAIHRLRNTSPKKLAFLLTLYAPRSFRTLRRRNRMPIWLGPVAINDTQLVANWEPERKWFGNQAIAENRIFQNYSTGWSSIQKEQLEFLSVDTRQEFFQPFYHPDLCSLLFNIPEKMRISPSDSRALQRQSYRSFLPQKLMTRRGKVHFDYRHVEDLKNPWVYKTLENLALEKEGLINGNVLRNRHEHLIKCYEANRNDFPPWSGFLWSVICVESWWKQMYSNIHET